MVLAVALLAAVFAWVQIPAHAAPVELTFWHQEVPPHRVAAFQKVIDEFNAQHPQIRVTQHTVSWNDVNHRLMAAIAARATPDFTFVNDALAAVLWETGTLQPVDELIDEIDRRWQLNPAEVAPFTHHGHTWAVPMFTLAHLFFYRTDLAAQAGWEGEVKTWDDLYELVRRMDALDPDVAGIALPASRHKYAQQCFYNFMITNGANIFDADGNVVFDNPRTVEALEMYGRLLEYSVPDAASLEWAGAELVFAEGKAASKFFFGSLYKQINESGVLDVDQFTAILPPVPPGGRQGAITSHNAVVVFTRDKAKQEAIREFLLFWLEPERYGAFLAEAEPGLYIPVHRAGMEAQSFWRHPLVAKYSHMIRKSIEAASTPYSYNIGFAPDHPIVTAAGEVDGSLVLAEVVQKVAFGEMTPAQAARWGQQRMEQMVE